jgi:SAM-dependent methyltransferase
MPYIPDFNDLRYLYEVGWFLYRAKYGHNHWTGSYSEERMVWSQMLLDEFIECSGLGRKWVEDKTVVTIGCGCSGDLAAWPAAFKIAVDPLLYTYQKLGMLIADAPGARPTTYLSVAVEDLPLLDESADVVICRNALDHMLDPRIGTRQVWRVLRNEGIFFLSVDIGGEPTPDEPSPFTRDSLSTLLDEQFTVVGEKGPMPPHNQGREFGLRVIARKKAGPGVSLDKEEILRAYEEAIRRGE